jgi:crotonobetainyl-CoA:carnitine CoA-transferase CaiB-like acyl-CoA transferase
LHERARTGRGRVIDAALFDVQVAMLANQASNQLVSGKAPTRMGNAHPNIVPYQVLPTRDGHMVLAIGNDGQFQRFCEAAGHAAVAHEPRFANNPARVQHRSALAPLLTAWTLEKTTAEWVALLEHAAVPCSPILDIAQVMAHPHVAARGMKLEAEGGQPPMIATPMRFDGQRPRAPLAPPDLANGQARWLDE